MLLLCCTTLQAQNFAADGIAYNIISESEKTVEVTSGGNYTGKIIIPSTVRYIDGEGMERKYTVRKIANDAFKNCTGLTSVTIPGSVTNVGTGAFLGCSGLKELYLEDGTEELYLSYSNIVSYATLVGAFSGLSLEKVYIGRDLTYPANPVDPHGPFQGINTLTSITIGKKVTKIGSKLFYNCQNLTGNITLPDSLVTVGENAFSGCKSITGLTIGKKAKNIGKNAFAGCSSMKEVTITSNGTTFESSTFKGCSALTKVNISDIADWCTMTFQTDDSNPMYNTNNLYVNNELLTELIIPDDITEIKPRLFFNCSTIESLQIGKNVETIGVSAFHNCSGITNLTIPDKVRTIGAYAFCGLTKVTSFTIPGNVSVIEDNTFGYMTSLQQIAIEEGITTINGRAFNHCEKLTSITIPNSVTSLGTAFQYCYKLNNAVLGNGIKTIVNDTFYFCTALNSLTIPPSVTSIGSLGYNCKNIKSVYISDLSAWCRINFTYEHPLANGASLYLNGEKIMELVIPDDITEIKQYTFYRCRGIAKVHINNNVKKIGKYAFNECYDISQVILGDSVTSIDTYAFYDCYALRSINFPNSLKSIGNNSFARCSLSDITIPASVTTIDQEAFRYCTSLGSVTSYIPADKLFTINTSVFYNVNSNCTLYVPYGAKEKYASTIGWNKFTNIVEMPATFDLKVSAAGYATLYLDFDALIPEGVEVYTASTVDGNRLLMQQVTGTLPANTGAIVRAEAGTYTFTESSETAQAIENNLLQGSVEEEYITPEEHTRYYVLAMKDGVVGMYEDALSGGTFKNNAKKAYLALKGKGLGIYDGEVDTENTGAQLSNSYYFDFSGTTAIDAVTECVENVYYDLSGRRVENPTQGIYIVNGKKILVK